jgi:hypothetical protein
MSDLGKLIAVALATVVSLVGSFWLGELWHIAFVPIFLSWMSVIFLATVGWDLRSKFRSPAFVVFFVAWLVMHLAVLTFVIGRLVWFYLLPALCIELWVGYTLAFHMFGLPPSGNPKDLG